MPAWRILAALAVLAAYALASHWLMVNAPRHPWTVAALFGPLLAGVALAGWKKRHVPSLLLAAGCAMVLAVVVAKGGVTDIQRMYVLQHGVIHALMAWSFALTLRPGAVPLITGLAERVHEHFTPPMRAWTRGLTQVWVGYFVGMIVVSVLLYALAPWPVWSLFCNVLTPLSAGALFVGEFVYRRWRHPEFERVSFSRALQAWRTAPAR